MKMNFMETAPISFEKGITKRMSQAGEEMVSRLNSGDVDYKDFQRIAGKYFPRQFYKNQTFLYIFNRIMNTYVLPKLDKQGQRTISRVQSAYEQNMRHQVRIDELTQVHTRRHFLSELEKRVIKTPRQKLLMIDLDHFKKCNDDYSHPEGDRALQQFGSLLNEFFQEDAFVGRYGGEEFIVAVPDEANNLDSKLDSLRTRFGDFVSQYYPKPDSEFKGNLSIGIFAADFSQSSETIKGAILKADQALIKAKETRNTTVIYRPELFSS